MKQLVLIREKKYAKRKIARPISLRAANHVVLKAKQPLLRRHNSRIRQIVRDTQGRFKIKIRALSVMPDHVHLIIKVSSRKQFADSLRYLTGQIALKISGAKLWRTRAWSRTLTWGRDQQTAELYVWNNAVKARCFRDDFDTTYILDGILQI